MEWLTTIVRGLWRPLQWWVVVAQWELGLRIRLGKKIKPLNPGIHFRVPFLDRIYIQSARLRTISFTGMQCLTKDGKTAVVSAAISFLIRDIVKLYDSVSTVEHTLETMVISHLIQKLAVLNSTEIRMSDLEFQSIEPELWGLAEVRVNIISFTICKTYRLITTDYRTGSNVWNLDDQMNNGERK